MSNVREIPWFRAIVTVAVAAAAIAPVAAGGCGISPEPAASPDELLEADREFARATLERGVDGWTEHFLAEGIMFPPAGRVVGRESIRAAMAETLVPGRRLEWEPESAVIAASGELGYTIGRWSSVVEREAEGDTVVARGSYVTIWRRDPEGRWKVAVDIGNEDVPPDG